MLATWRQQPRPRLRAAAWSAGSHSGLRARPSRRLPGGAAAVNRQDEQYAEVLFTAEELRQPQPCSNGSSDGSNGSSNGVLASQSQLSGPATSSSRQQELQSSSTSSSSLKVSSSLDCCCSVEASSSSSSSSSSSVTGPDTPRQPSPEPSSFSSTSETSSSGRLEDSSSSPSPPAAAAVAAAEPSSSSSSSSSSADALAASAPPWPPDVPWGGGVVLQVMGLWMLAYLAVGRLLVPALLLLLEIDQAALSPRATALLNLALDSGQVVVTLALLALTLGRYKPRQRGLFPFAWRGATWLPRLAAGAALFPLIDWLAFTSVRLLSGADDAGLDVWSAQVEAGIAHDSDWLTGAAYLLVVGLCAPLWEEAIFRGFLLASLAKALPPGPAVATSALIFALCHSRSETFAPLLLLGLVIGWLYQATANLLPPMLLHGLWNSYVLGTLALRLRCGLDPVAAAAVMAGGLQAGLLAASAAAAAWRHYSGSRSGSGSKSGSSGNESSSSSISRPSNSGDRSSPGLGASGAA